jgi:hypothetical protein
VRYAVTRGSDTLAPASFELGRVRFGQLERVSVFERMDARGLAFALAA